jgi:DNA-binding MarR family transcriptional regulator
MPEDYKLIVMLKEGPRRQEVLHVVATSHIPLSSSDISKKTSMLQSNVVRILGELESKGAVKEVTGRRRNRRYKITRKGSRALSKKKELESKT